jgi:uncharacterized protein (TIGR03437 family)
LENFPAAKAALLRAAAKWESIIQTEGVPGGVEFAVAVSLDFGPTFFGQAYQSGNVVGNSLIGQRGSVWVAPYAQFYVEQALNPHQNRIFSGLPFPIFTDIGQTPITRYTIPQRITTGFQVLPDDAEYKIGFNSAAKFDMDPTYAPGERGGITAIDLTALGYFTYRVKPDTTVLEILAVDDNSREQSLPMDTALLVNRVTPARAPATLQSVRVQFADGVTLAGKSLRVVAFADPARTGQPPNNPTLLVERAITLQSVPESRLLEVMLPNPPVVNGGDLYVGVQAPQGTLAFAADSNGEARFRSFRSLNNGASFQPLQATGGAPLNLMVSAAVEAKYNASLNAPPEIKQLSQTAALTTEELELLVFGRNFLPQLSGGNTSSASVVRINGKDQITNFLSASQLRARISSNEVRGKSSVTITVFTPTANGGLESNAIALNVVSSAPAPQVTKLEPALAVVGSSPGTQIFEPLIMFDPMQNRYVPRPVVIGPEGERVFLVLFGTGFRHNSGISAVAAILDGLRLPATFAGAQGNLTGVDQLNIELAQSLKGRGQVILNCTINGRAANPVSIVVQ